MATAKFTVPNWSQAQLALAVNLEPKKIAVRNESDRSICFLQYDPRKEFLVDKTTGEVIET